MASIVGVRCSLRRQHHVACRLGVLAPPQRCYSDRRPPPTTERTTRVGHTTIDSSDTASQRPKLPFYFDTGFALFAKRRSRPFPPPFLSLPSGSFSDPLSTHDRSQDRRPHVNNELIRGITNGDDAVLVEENFVGANDGVGAWVQRPRGHAAYGRDALRDRDE